MVKEIFTEPGMAIGLAYGHIGSQGIDDIIHGGDIARTIMWTFGPTVAGTGIGYYLSTKSDPKNQAALLVGGTLIGAIGSSIYQTYKDDKDGKTKYSKNTNFYMTFVLLLAAVVVALSNSKQNLGEATVQEAQRLRESF